MEEVWRRWATQWRRRTGWRSKGLLGRLLLWLQRGLRLASVVPENLKIRAEKGLGYRVLDIDINCFQTNYLGQGLSRTCTKYTCMHAAALQKTSQNIRGISRVSSF